MTLSVLEGHSPIASHFKCDIWYLWRVARSLCICRASCLDAVDAAEYQSTMLHYCYIILSISEWFR